MLHLESDGNVRPAINRRKIITVTGKLIDYKSKPKIIVANPNQLKTQ